MAEYTCICLPDRPLLETNLRVGEKHAEARDVLVQIIGKGLTHNDPAVRALKKDIDDVILLENADGPWKFSECFRNGPLKIRHRYLLTIGMLI